MGVSVYAHVLVYQCTCVCLNILIYLFHFILISVSTLAHTLASHPQHSSCYVTAKQADRDSVSNLESDCSLLPPLRTPYMSLSLRITVL